MSQEQKAPERIWVRVIGDKAQTGVSSSPDHGGVEYVRSDTVSTRFMAVTRKRVGWRVGNESLELKGSMYSSRYRKDTAIPTCLHD